MNRTTLQLIHIGIPLVWALTPMMLAAIGVLNYQRLKSLRRYMIAANLIVAIFVITPEIFTQIVAAITLLVCYEITVLIGWLRERRKGKTESL